MKKLLYTSLIMFLFLGASAANIYVSNTADSGLGSLREAIITANSAYSADNIIFDIPLTDAGYDAITGVWTITLLSPLPYVYAGNKNIDGTTQTLNHGNTNISGPEIMITCNNMLFNAFSLVSPNNTIKGFVFNGFQNAIVLYNSTASNNTIAACYFGTNTAGNAVGVPNENGISLANGAINNHILDNLISGNTNAGIAALDAGGSIIRGNKIGTDITGLFAIPNMYGIGMENSANNIIGGTLPSHRNIISGNSFTGIGLNGLPSTNNTITGNFIGTDITGTQVLSNDHGIILSYANNTTIGGNEASKRNIISGNISAGIVMNGTGTRQNIVKGNYIGTDTSGLIPISNYAGIILKSKSNSNIIGGITPEDRNIVSANIEMGIYVEASDSNIIIGNYIGPDVTGLQAFKTGDTLLQANGIEFNTVSKNNRLGGYAIGERNVISGNRVYGMVYYGNVSYNDVIGNYIGVDAAGNNALPNATGICVDGGSNNNPIINNVLSGNISYGIFIVTTGSNYNIFKGNIVGLNASGTDTIPNESGLLIAGGTKYNIIGGDNLEDRNIFSGNRFAGLQIVDNGTQHNTIKGNYIGSDIHGNVPMPNYYGVCIISNASDNLFDNNYICGNKGFGVLMENARSNTLVRNKIGISANNNPMGNGAAGIILYAGSQNNIIGAPSQGNIIAHHDTAGILIMDNNTVCNKISGNSIYSNQYLGIDIFPPGANTNDAGDNDEGPNNLMNTPIIATAAFNPVNNYAWITGQLDTENPQNCVVELFIAEPNFFNSGDGKTYIESVIPDAAGNWSYFGTGVASGTLITATATNACGSTSEFCENFQVVLQTEDILIENAQFSVYPNPASERIFINSNKDIRDIFIFNTLGQKLIHLSSTISEIDIRGLDCGIYFMRFYCDGVFYVEKIVVRR